MYLYYELFSDLINVQYKYTQLGLRIMVMQFLAALLPMTFVFIVPFEIKRNFYHWPHCYQSPLSFVPFEIKSSVKGKECSGNAKLAFYSKHYFI